MNIFLGTCAQPNLFVSSISAHKIVKGTCKQDIYIQQRLPTGCDQFLLRLTKTGSGGDYRHAACVRYSYSDMQWYMIDSEHPGPKVLSSDEWLDLDGEIRLLYHGKCGTLIGGTAPAFCQEARLEAWFNPSKEIIEVAGQTIDASPIQQQQQSAEAIQIDWTGHESNEKAAKEDCVKAKDLKLGADHIQSDEIMWL